MYEQRIVLQYVIYETYNNVNGIEMSPLVSTN